LVQLQKFTLIQRPTMSVKLVVLYKSELWQTSLTWMVPHYSTQRMTQLQVSPSKICIICSNIYTIPAKLICCYYGNTLHCILGLDVW